jgi:hypothetical protein
MKLKTQGFCVKNEMHQGIDKYRDFAKTGINSQLL